MTTSCVGINYARSHKSTMIVQKFANNYTNQMMRAFATLAVAI